MFCISKEAHFCTLLNGVQHKKIDSEAKKLLEKNGLTVDVANDGLEAVRAVKERSYDLIFMDIMISNSIIMIIKTSMMH